MSSFAIFAPLSCKDQSEGTIQHLSDRAHRQPPARAAHLEAELNKTDAKYEKRRDQLSADKQKVLAAIEAMTAEEREAQAIVKDPYAMPDSGELFATDATGGRQLATIDRSVFEAKGDREAIRMITLYWSWDRENPPKVTLIQQFKERFDFAALAKLIAP